MKRTILSIIVVIVLISSDAMAAIYENGLSNDITYRSHTFEYVEIRDSFLGGITQVNLIDGADVGKVDVYENSALNIDGGEVSYSTTFSSNYIRTHDSSRMSMSAGRIYGLTYAYDSSQIIISGGIAGGVYSYGNSEVYLSGGTINYPIYAYNNSNVYVSGGTVGTTINAYDTSVLTFIGKDFVFGGVEVDYGTFDTMGNASVHAPLSGLTLAGDPISYDLYFEQGTQVVLIPEPATMLLLLGALPLLRRNRK